MKKLILILIIFVQGITAPAQFFNRSFNLGQNLALAWNVDTLSNDSILIHAANFLINGNVGIGTVKLDDFGRERFSKTFSISSKNLYVGWANSTAPTQDGNFIMGGGIQDTSSDFGYLMKFTPLGDTLWTKTFGDTVNFHTFRQAKELDNGDFIVVGQNINGGWLVLTDSLGNQKWSRTYSGHGDVEHLTSVFHTQNGGFILGGSRRHLSPHPYSNNLDPYLIKVDSAGRKQWAYIHDTPYSDPNAYVIQTLDGNYVFASSISSPNTNLRKAALVKVDAGGNLLWEKTYGKLSQDHSFQRVLELKDSTLIAVGRRDDSIYNYGLMIKTNAHGDSLWVGEYEHDISWRPSSNELWDVALMADGGFVACGETRGRPNGGAFQQDAWVIRVDSNGCILANCLVGNESLELKAESLKLYPNPTNGLVNLESMVPLIRIEVYNLQGQKILEVNPTESQFELPHESGLYLLRIQDEKGKVFSEKVIKR